MKHTSLKHTTPRPRLEAKMGEMGGGGRNGEVVVEKRVHKYAWSEAVIAFNGL